MVANTIWVNSFDFNLTIGAHKFTVPGDEIHARLKHHENQVRMRQFNIKFISKKLHELDQLNAMVTERSALDASQKTQRIDGLENDLITYIFASASRSAATKEFKEIYLATLLANKSEIQRGLIQSHVAQFEQKNFSSIKSFGAYLKDIGSSIHREIYITYTNYTSKNTVSSSPSKKKKIEAKASVYLADHAKYSSYSDAQFEECKRTLVDEVDRARAAKVTDEVEGNIVLANLGFLVETVNLANPDGAPRLDFLTFPITSANKSAHSIYHEFNEAYNYEVIDSAGKHCLRNSLLDTQLSAQLGGSEKFDYGLDYHSERALYLYMTKPEFMNMHLNKLKKTAAKKQQRIVKILWLVIDMHSSYYMCSRCQHATIMMQSQSSPFLEQFSAHIKKQFSPDAIPVDGLHLITRVSADVPFGRGVRQIGRAQHKPYNGALLEDTILAMDSTSLALRDLKLINRHARFSSGLHTQTLFSSGGANLELTKNILLAYNDITKPTQTEAASLIQKTWRLYLQSKQ